MSKNVYRVTGTFQMGRVSAQAFSKEVIANDEEDARERTLSIMGSKHGVNRREIRIDGIRKIGPDEIQDQTVRGLIGQD